MKFELLPVVDIMIELYLQPRSPERFQKYLTVLQGDKKGDLALPLSGYNPMAKEHVLNKLYELKELDAEGLMATALQDLNMELRGSKLPSRVKVALTVADDLQGGWTNRYTADYDSKFKLSGLVNRNFCTPILWVSETPNVDLIKTRTLEYCYRTLYWLSNTKPVTLEDHIKQELFVYEHVTAPMAVFDENELTSFYENHKGEADYSTIFTFLYGDEAAASLGHTKLGIKDEFAGYRFAKWLEAAK